MFLLLLPKKQSLTAQILQRSMAQKEKKNLFFHIIPNRTWGLKLGFFFTSNADIYILFILCLHFISLSVFAETNIHILL